MAWDVGITRLSSTKVRNFTHFDVSKCSDRAYVTSITVEMSFKSYCFSNFQRVMDSSRTKVFRIVRTVLAVLFLVFGLSFVLVPKFVSSDAANWPSVGADPAPTPQKATKPPVAPKPSYKEFPHDAKAHRMECSSCHKFPSSNWEKVRKEDPFPDITDYPKHDSCVQCHREQFFKGSPPNICTVCHTNPGPRDSSRHPFPNPREIFDLSPKGKTAESDFVVGFPHGKHMELLARASDSGRATNSGPSAFRFEADPNAVCATCHVTMNPQGDSDDEYVSKPPANIGDGFWLKKGTFKSGPLGHTTCFSCHNADSGLSPAPADCGTCHAPKERYAGDLTTGMPEKIGGLDKVTILAWRKRASSANFRHEWFSHAELACNTCHEVNSMNTATVAGRKVGVLSCGGAGAGCHITPTADDGGILNFEVDSRGSNASFACTKCHQEFGKRPVPQSHMDALKKIAEQK